ncbi:MAG TPA: DUF4097 family beta strand repeat-containing protein [Vicinamibacterales bacterium]|nr:DUF4097 family beta strand repeat-containing protein [Vicinamibacterales bacterium]
MLIPVLAAALGQASAAPAFADQAAVAREAARAVTRYQGNRGQRVEQSDRQTRSAKIGAAGTLDLRNVAGDITVTAGSGDTATVEIIRTARGTSDADAREQLALVRIEAAESAGRLEVREIYPDRRGRDSRRNFSVTTEYRVTAPAGARVRADSVSGSISVAGIRGEQTLNTISGNVLVRDAGRLIKGQSISGNVEIVSAQDDAVVELSSTSGNVTARGIRLRRIDLGSISGRVAGRDLQSDQASLHTISGNVEYSGSLTSGGRYEFRTHSGDVRLTLGSDTGFELEASTFSGEVRSGLQLRIQGELGRRNRTIRGTYGDGRARVTARSFSGDVVINAGK